MDANDLMAGLKLWPLPGRRDQYSPEVVTLPEAWVAVAACCEPGCGWLRTHRDNRDSTDLGLAAKHHATKTGHQTLSAWYAAERHIPEPPEACREPPKAPPSHSETRGGPDGHPTHPDSKQTNTRKEPK